MGWGRRWFGEGGRLGEGEETADALLEGHMLLKTGVRTDTRTHGHTETHAHRHTKVKTVSASYTPFTWRL